MGAACIVPTRERRREMMMRVRDPRRRAWCVTRCHGEIENDAFAESLRVRRERGRRIRDRRARELIG